MSWSSRETEGHKSIVVAFVTLASGRSVLKDLIALLRAVTGEVRDNASAEAVVLIPHFFAAPALFAATGIGDARAADLAGVQHVIAAPAMGQSQLHPSEAEAVVWHFLRLSGHSWLATADRALPVAPLTGFGGSHSPAAIYGALLAVATDAFPESFYPLATRFPDQ
jgi:hypothetical protein